MVNKFREITNKDRRQKDVKIMSNNFLSKLYGNMLSVSSILNLLVKCRPQRVYSLHNELYYTYTYMSTA